MNNTVVIEGEVSLTTQIDGDPQAYVGGGVDVNPLTVTENGTYEADPGAAYNPVTVEVPGLVPTGTLEITENGEYDVTEYAEASVDVYPVLQSKAVTPSEQAQTVTADSGYYGLSEVDVEAIPSEYIIPSGSVELTANGSYNVTDKATALVNVPDLYGETLAEVIEGTLTDLEKEPIVTQIKPYAFCVPKGIPDGYTEVEYVSSTTSVDFQLDTGIFTDGVIEVELVTQGNRTTSNSQIVFSSGTGGNAGTWFGCGGSTTVWAFGAATGSTTTIPYTTKITANLKVWRDTVSHIRATVVGGGKTETIARDGASTPTISDIVLFATATSGVVAQASSLYGANARIYLCKIWKDGILVANYVPCQNAEGVYGLYDTERQMFTAINNRLTGGAAVTPTPSETGALESVDTDATEIGAFAFYNNDLASLTLRANQVVTIGDNALAYTPIASGQGTIYVPSDLLAAYRAAYPDYNFTAI